MLFLIIVLGIYSANAKLIYDLPNMEQEARLNITFREEATTVTVDGGKVTLDGGKVTVEGGKLEVDGGIEEAEVARRHRQRLFQSLYFYAMADKSVEHRERNELIMEYIQRRFPRAPREAERELVQVIKLMEMLVARLRPRNEPAF